MIKTKMIKNKSEILKDNSTESCEVKKLNIYNQI